MTPTTPEGFIGSTVLGIAANPRTFSAVTFVARTLHRG